MPNFENPQISDKDGDLKNTFGAELKEGQTPVGFNENLTIARVVSHEKDTPEENVELDKILPEATRRVLTTIFEEKSVQGFIGRIVNVRATPEEITIHKNPILKSLQVFVRYRITGTMQNMSKESNINNDAFRKWELLDDGEIRGPLLGSSVPENVGKEVMKRGMM